METLPTRRRLFHTPPAWVKCGNIFFITICCAERRANSPASREVFGVLAAAGEHYALAESFWAHLFLAMPDHLHALLSFPAAKPMDKVLRDWKRFAAREASVHWQDGFFDHRLRHEDSFEEKARYIRLNPVRAGLVGTPAEWPYVCSR